MKSEQCKMRGPEDGGLGAGVRAQAEAVFDAPSRRGNFSLGGAAARALPLPQLRKSLRRMTGRALSGFVGPLNFKKLFWRPESPPYMRTGGGEKMKITKQSQI